MPSPVDDLRDEIAADDRSAQHEPRTRTQALLLFRSQAELWTCGRAARLTELLVRRRFALRALHHQARLQLPQEGRIVVQLVGELRLHAALRCGALGQLLELVGAPIDDLISLRRHFFAGGSSPVAMRQIRDAARRDAIVAAAPIAA